MQSADRQAPSIEATIAHADQRLPTLDGVRGLAILAVVLYHFVGYASTEVAGGRIWVDRFVHEITGAGWTGVDLFFVLSGFLITGILLDARERGGSYFGSFYARRVLRIFPAHYVYLGLLFLLIPLLAPSADSAVDALAEDRLWFAGFLGNILVVIHGATRPDFFVTGHLWSLGVEEQFYLTWPAIVLLLGRQRLVAACAVIIVLALGLRIGLAAGGVDGAVSLTLTPARMDSLAAGGLIAAALRQPGAISLLRRFALPVAGASALAVGGLAVANNGLHALDTSSHTLGYTLIALAFAGLLYYAIHAVPGTRAHRLLTASPLVPAGRYSYAMYLVHLPIAWLLVQRADITESLPSVAGSHLPGEALFTVVAFVPTFVLAWISWRVIETPFLRLKERFAQPAPQPTGQERPAQRHLAPATSAAKDR